MRLIKKIKCLHCNEILTENDQPSAKTCSCGHVSMTGRNIFEGVEGKDWVDVSQKLLNEIA